MDRQLKDRLAELLGARGASGMTFRDYMAFALYDEVGGYYRGKGREIGKKGDFYTSVSVGAVFGKLIAAHFAEVWETLGRPGRFGVIEQGANDGTLMRDVLDALGKDHEDCAAAVEGWIVEPDAGSRARQKKALGDRVNRVKWCAELAGIDLPAGSGVLFSNELIDAMPVHVVRWDGEKWGERMVKVGAEGEFEWEDGKLSSEGLRAQVEKIDVEGFEVGYITEVGLDGLEWMRKVGACDAIGHVLVIDYGFARNDYYLPSRVEGTLQVYRAHTKGESPLENPGDADMTAHVDFTSLAEAGMEGGFEVMGFVNQSRFLTVLAEPWLRSLDGQVPDAEVMKKLGQFRTLTNPGDMGGKFQVLGLWRRGDQKFPALSGFRYAGEVAGALDL